MISGRLAFALALTVCLPSAAVADASGTYEVTGINPENGAEYSGTVAVERNGETYIVTWTFGQDKVLGIGIGDGPPSQDHRRLVVGYGNAGGAGVADYVRGEDGSWSGTWSYAGSKVVSTEVWTLPGKTRTHTAGGAQAPSPLRKPMVAP